MLSVSVIVPARNARATLPRTLERLAAQEGIGRCEVIVVDDGSTDGTGELARGSRLLPVVLSGAGEGPSAARNLGAAHATGDLLVFLDADCWPVGNWLERGVAAMRGADLVQGAVSPPPDAIVGPFDRTLWVQRAHGLYESANLFVRRELFERIGGFESWLRPGYGIELGEDVLFGWRARRLGARTEFCAQALVHHAVFARGPAQFVAERGRLRFFPALARRVPELRESFFYRRWFLTRRSAAFDLALVSVLAARRWRPLVIGTLPYLALLGHGARRGGPHRSALVAAADVCADAVGMGALASGSLRHRSPVL